MTVQDVYKILKIITDTIKGKNIVWRLDGSANLLAQGIDTQVRDIDIDTTLEGMDIFENAFKKYITKDFYSERNKCRILIFDINGFELEINSYGDRKKDMWEKTKIINWQGLDVPIIPLKYAKIFYQLINRQEKVDLINKYLSKKIF
ncbi:hypothetical protein KAZ01_02185 [Candidatus Gracilibacteria bacterium]|nr:hypothetical protein [Candidatus Gracilibacteria bacterium]